MSTTSAPVISDAIGVRAPADSFSELADRLVETGIPWNTPAPAFAIPCAIDSWSTSIRYSWRAANARASPAVWEKPISTSANAAITIVAAWSPISESAGISGAGSPLGTSPTSATPCAPRSNSRAPRMPADHEHERARHRGREEAQAEDHRQRQHADEQRRPVHVAERADPGPELPPRVVPLGVGPGQLRQLADHDVDGGAGEEAGDDGLGEEAARSSPGAAAPAPGTAARWRSRSPRRARPPRRPRARRRRPRRPPPRRARSSARSRSAATCRRARR